MPWYLWLDRPRAGWENMSVDHALLDLAADEGAVFVRLYRWNPFCLSFGRHEPALIRYGRERVEAQGLDCVRRPTGGRAVWHARELTYAVAAPAAFGSLPYTCDRIHQMLAEALRLLGAEPSLAPRPARAPGPGAGACFATPVGGELVIHGRKVVGSAQFRSDGALLQHGSLLLEDDQRIVHHLAGVVDPGGAPPEAPLAQMLGRTVTFQEAAAAIGAALRAWAVDWREAPVRRILGRAEAHARHYRDPAWTWCR
jgi:lipoyl(octanoyl) transferase